MTDRDSATPSDASVAMTTPTSPQIGRDSDPDVTVTRRIDAVACALARLGNTEGATVTGIVAHPSLSTGEVADRYALEHRSVQRAVAKARKVGLIMGDSGAWVPVLPHLDTPATAASVAERLAERAAAAEAAALTYKDTKYASRVERDVAVVLDGLGLSPERQVPYSTLIPGCERAWTADFVLTVMPKVIIEVTSDRPGAVDTIEAKRTACRSAGVAFVAVSEGGGLLDKIRSARAVLTVYRSATSNEVITRNTADSYIMGGCHVVRAGVNRTIAPDAAPRAPADQAENAAAAAFHAAEERAAEVARKHATDAISTARADYRAKHPEFVEALELVEAHEAAEGVVITEASSRVMSAYRQAASDRMRNFMFGAVRLLPPSQSPPASQVELDDNVGDHDAEDDLLEDLL